MAKNSENCLIPPWATSVRLLVERVIVSPTELEVRLRANGLEKMVLELQADRLQTKLEEVAA